MSYRYIGNDGWYGWLMMGLAVIMLFGYWVAAVVGFFTGRRW